MIKRALILVTVACCFWLAASLNATETVTFAVSGTTGAATVTGQFVAGSVHTVIFSRSDSAWSSGAVYKLTVKADGRYDDAPFVLVTGDAFTVAGQTLTVSVDLLVTELYAYLGRAQSRMIMLELSDSTSAHVIRNRVPVYNSVYRPEDTPPANPAVNSYTDAEVDAAIAAIPAGMDPISDPIDGWTVESTDAGQIRIGDIPSVHITKLLTEYPETTTLATGDYLLLYDASEGALRKVSLNTLLTWITTQLGL
ncbi:MAG: hypothetical protein RRC34_02940 [Lentisphaeria bacterium]|nr:hypothetical protein [Lentisphaeria bacterium]